MVEVSDLGTAKDSPHGQAIKAYFVTKSGCLDPVGNVAGCRIILMCFTNRCGSTLVAAELSSLGYCSRPNSGGNFEFFNSNFVASYCDEHNLLDLTDYLDHVTREFRSPLGFFFSKVSIDQLAWLHATEIIGVAFPSPILLRVVRRDLLAQAISYSIAEQTGAWTSLHATDDRFLPSYDRQAIIQIMTYFEAANTDADRFFERLGQAPATFVYEEILADRAKIAIDMERVTGKRPGFRKPKALNVQRQGTELNEIWARRFQRGI